MRLTIHLLSFFLLLSWAALADPTVGSDSRYGIENYKRPPALLMSVLDAPHKAKVYGKDVVAYELLLSNLEETECRIQGLELFSGDRVIASYSPQEIPAISRQFSAPGGQLESPVIPAKETVVLFLWLEHSTALKDLRHRLSFDLGPGPGWIEGAQTQVVDVDPVTVALPFRAEGRWAAIGAPSNEAGHRRAALIVNGRPWVSQRFAIDWIMLGPDDQMATGDGSKNEQHHCYGVEALAVGDGEIVAIHDGVPENRPSMTERAVPITLDTVGGNWVAIKLGEGRYGMYAHLIPGSLKVKKGDKVRKGDVVGLVGNSGNSTAPHLHFHVSTTPHWIDSVGLPYLIDSYTSVGKVVESGPDLEQYGVEAHPEGDSVRTNDLPQESEVIRVGPSS